MNKNNQIPPLSAEAITALEANPNLLNKALNASGIPLVIRSAELLPLFANQAFVDFYGYSLKEMREITTEEMLPQDTFVLYKDVIQPSMQAGDSWEGEYVIRLKSGRTTPVWGRFDPVTDENNTLTHVISIMRDASGSMRLRNALTQTERHLKFLTDNTSDCLFRLRLTDMRYDYVSPAIKAITGYSPQEFYETPALYYTLTPEVWKGTISTWFDELKAGHSRYEYQAPITHKDGTLRWVTQRVTLVFDEDGRAIAIEGIATDDTSRKEAQTALRAAEQDFRLMVENITDVVWTQNNATHFTFATPSVEALWGYTPEELYKLDPDALFTEGSRQKVQEYNKRRLSVEAEGKYDNVDRLVLEHIRKDGSHVWAESVIRRLFDDDDEPVGFIGTTRDITENRRNEEALAKSEDRFRTLFEESPISLWEEDLTRLKAYFDELKAEGVDDFRAYFYDHPDALAKCGTLVDVVDVNKATIDLLRAKDRDDLLGNLDKVLTESSMAAFTEEMILLASGGCEYCGEITHRTLEGEIIWVVVHFLVPTEYQDSLSRVIVSLIDVTPRKRAEQALMESEERYRVLVENSQEGVIVSSDNEHLYINEAMTGITGYSSDDLRKMALPDLVHPGDKKGAVSRFFAETPATRRDGFATFRILTANGQARWLTLTVKPIMWGGEKAELAVYTDVTIHKVLEDELRAAHSEMEDRVTLRTRELSEANIKLTQEAEERERAQEHILSLTQQLIRIQEDERQRISRDLHDKVAQDLSSIVLKMETLFDGAEHVDPIIRERGDTVTEVVRGAIAAVRGIAYGLRPPALDQIGLIQALENHCMDVTRQTGLLIDFVATGIEDRNLDIDAKINLYRMIQEAINNIVKHAGASRVKVRMVKSHPDVLVRIEDNGCGFDVEKRLAESLEKRRMGLRSMEERARLIGGSVDIQSRLGTGTRIVFETPITHTRRR